MEKVLFQEKMYFSNFKEVAASLKEIYQTIVVNGYVLLNMKSADRKTFVEVMKLFGNFQFHVRSDSEGVVGVNKSEIQKIKSVKDKYSGLDNRMFPPHTDGSYLNGITKHKKKFAYVGPPALVALQCERPSRTGGENILVDGRKILLELLKNDSKLLQSLLQDECLNFCRDDQAAIHLPLFQYRGNNVWRVRIRSDKMVFCSEWSYESMKKFISKYTLNEEYYNYINLKSGQILIMDNFRILHGRKAFQSENGEKISSRRSMRRIWIAENPLRIYRNVADVDDEHRVFNNYSDYICPSEELYTPSLLLGIKLNSENTSKCLNLKNSNL